jgi:L-alanine-DL-glutamate epimerase-like enolase superfamily enzyme
MLPQTRRSFLASLTGLSAVGFLGTFHQLAAAERGKVKITDIKTMILKGPRTYTLVRIETDAGVSGFAEAYGSPGLGVREAIHGLKSLFIGQDPLQIERLYTQDNFTDGSAHAQQRAMSGIEMALWDLAGRLLGVPVHALLGGKYRDKVRLYDHATPRDFFDKAVLRDWAAEVKAKPSGISCHKFGPFHSKPGEDLGHDPANRLITSRDFRRLRQGFENCREALGWDHDLMIGCHWEFDVRTSVDLAEAVAPIKPLFLEDPMPVNYSESWRRLADKSPVPICTGENWMRRAEALPFIVNSAVDILHIDLRNCGGFLESKKLADLGELYAMPAANHNTGSIVNGMNTVHWASTIRDHLAVETVFFSGGWMDDVILHDGPLCQGGFVTVPTKPGLGLELNPDVVKAHLAEGEKWWG